VNKTEKFSVHIFIKTGSIYIKPRPKWYFYTYSRTHFASANASFKCDICL